MANFCSDKKFAFDHINELGTPVDRLPGPKVFAGPRENLFLTCKLAIFKGNPVPVVRFSDKSGKSTKIS